MRRILITGASGFLGTAITREAAKRPDWEVYAVSSGRRTVTVPDGVQLVKCDLRDFQECERLMQRVRPEVMVHLAWNLEQKGFLDSNSNLLWLQISLNLLQLFEKYQGKRFVFSGSSAEYGYEVPVCKESGEQKPSDLYGVCKAAFTSIATNFCSSRKIEFVSARYFSVYGAGEVHLLHAVPIAIDQLLRGKIFVCKGPNNQWDYIYIDDAAAATIQIAASDYCGIVNVASGVGTAMRQLFSKIAHFMNKEELLVFENEELPGKILVADTTILNERLGFRCKTDLNCGIEKTIQWRMAEG